MDKSTRPVKPYKDFPLFAAGNGQWAKKIRGKRFNFGVWSDWKSALAKYELQRDDLFAGRTPRLNADGLTLADLGNQFLTAKTQLAGTGEITQGTLRTYVESTTWLVEYFGNRQLVTTLQPNDFTRLRAFFVEKKNLGMIALGNTIQRVRSVFKFAYDQGLIDRPLRFGQMFRKPGRRAIRLDRQKKPPRMFTPAELLTLIENAPLQMRAMILLGLNCGFGNNDCATLPLSALNLESGLINHPRPKTGTERLCPLWPETIFTLRQVLAHRSPPKNAEFARLVFITKYGQGWAKPQARANTNPISHRFRGLLNKTKLRGVGRSFYTLRHVFETVAGGCKDQVAVNSIMGHVDGSMAALYREGIDADRLYVVVDHVRNWLDGKKLNNSVKSPLPTAAGQHAGSTRGAA